MMMLTSDSNDKGRMDLSAAQKASLHTLLQAYENVVDATTGYCDEHKCDFCPMLSGKKCPATMMKRLAKYLDGVAGRTRRNGD